MVTFAESAMPEPAYEPPVLIEIGTVAELTLGRCWFGEAGRWIGRVHLLGHHDLHLELLFLGRLPP